MVAKFANLKDKAGAEVKAELEKDANLKAFANNLDGLNDKAAGNMSVREIM